jgi:hypothetical protein
MQQNLIEAANAVPICTSGRGSDGTHSLLADAE